MPKKLIMAVVDGLGPGLLDASIAAGVAPTLDWLAGEGSRTDRCASTFPSLTPVCLSTLVTGCHPSGTLIPSMTWYHRGQGRFVEYGSSIAATLAEGTKQMVDDVLVNLNLLHLSPRVTTVFEALDDAGLVTAAINTYVIRGRTRHPITRPAARRVARSIGIVDAVYGPRRYFLGDLFFSDRTGAPINIGGSIDRHGGHVARWLVTRDGFDFLFFYLYETDAVQHKGGDAVRAVAVADRGLEMLVDAAGGRERFLDRYAVIVVADHAQSRVTDPADASAPFDDLKLFRGSRRSDPSECDLAVAASNRASMVYLLPRARLTVEQVARRALSSPAADVVCHRDGEWYVARRAAGVLRCRGGGERTDGRGNRFQVEGDRDLLEPDIYPNALERVEGILDCPTAGEVVVSATPGFEFADSGGVHHAGGGSHGSLRAEDSFVPLVLAGFEGHHTGLPDQPSITDMTPLARRHFGVR